MTMYISLIKTGVFFIVNVRNSGVVLGGGGRPNLSRWWFQILALAQGLSSSEAVLTDPLTV